MASSNNRELLFKAMKTSLNRASKQIDFIGDMWKEDIFRYIIVQELEKKKIWGKLAESTNKSPRLILERRYGRRNTEIRSRSQEIDIASIITKKSKNTQSKKNPLAIEVKAKRGSGISWSEFRQEMGRCQRFLKKEHGKYYYDLAVVVQGGQISGKIPQISMNHMSASKKSNFLIGFLDENGKSFVRWWHSKPIKKAKKTDKRKWVRDYSGPVKPGSKIASWKKAKKSKNETFSWNGGRFKVDDYKQNRKTNRLNRKN